MHDPYRAKSGPKRADRNGPVTDEDPLTTGLADKLTLAGFADSDLESMRALFRELPDDDRAEAVAEIDGMTVEEISEAFGVEPAQASDDDPAGVLVELDDSTYQWDAVDKIWRVAGFDGDDPAWLVVDELPDGLDPDGPTVTDHDESDEQEAPAAADTEAPAEPAAVDSPEAEATDDEAAGQGNDEPDPAEQTDGSCDDLGETPPEPEDQPADTGETTDDVPSAAAEVVEWIGSDAARAGLAQQVENARARGPRPTVVAAIDAALTS